MGPNSKPSNQKKLIKEGGGHSGSAGGKVGAKYAFTVYLTDYNWTRTKYFFSRRREVKC